MKSINTYLIYPIALSFLSPVAIAQSNTSTYSDEEASIERVIVRATRAQYPISTVPNTIRVIEQEAIQRQLTIAPDLSSLLANLVPGFSPSRQKLSGFGETLRGREPLYLIDGVPQSNPLRNGSRDGHTIDPFMIERIEVIKGANAIQGLGASGGIINIVTKSAQPNTHSLQVGINSSSEFDSDSLGTQLNYIFSQSVQDTDFVAGLSHRTTGMFLDGNGDFVGVDSTQGDLMDSESLNLFTKVKHTLDEHQSISVMLNHFNLEGNGDFSGVSGNAELGLPATSIGQPTVGEPAENKVNTASIDYLNGAFYNGQLNLQFFYQDFASLFGGGVFGVFQDPAFGPDLFDQSENHSEKFGVRSSYALNNIKNTHFDLVIGLDILSDTTFQSLAATGRKWVPKTEFRNIAPFAQVRYSGFENITLAAGVRYEDAKLDVGTFTTLAGYNSIQVQGGTPTFDDVLGNIGAVYQISDEFRVFASFNEGYSMPDVGRVLRGINQPVEGVKQFLDLQPIISDNREVGLEFVNDSIELSMSYFVSGSDFGSRLQADEDGIFSVQREKTEIDGIEISASYYIYSHSFSLNFAKTSGEFDSDDDGRVDTDLNGANIPPERLNINWLNEWNDQLQTSVQVNVLRDTDFSDSADFEGYTTVDATLTYALPKGTIHVGIENLTDKQFITYYSQTNPNNRRYFAGRGRHINLSWQVDF